jgi:hypothetical protein
MSTSTDRMRRLRERRAASLQPVEGDPPRPADDLLLPAVEETLAALQLGDDGLAAAQLARQYARIIDGGRDPAWCLRWLGPLLLSSLESMQATPMSRRDQKKPGPSAPSQLDRLRAVRRRDGA